VLQTAEAFTHPVIADGNLILKSPEDRAVVPLVVLAQRDQFSALLAAVQIRFAVDIKVRLGTR